jgi:amino acid adenylation domain-containing protein
MLNGVAIIGMSGRFPGASGIAEFWRNLCAGCESITRFTDAELEDSFSPEIRSSANFVKARPILPGIELFDAPFFGMYPREAELTDPQHRLFLEICWEALEDGGYDPAAYPGAIGVFAGSSPNSYFLRNVCADRATIEEFTSNYQVGCYPMLLGAGQDFLATRVSYKLDLRGPSLTLQTACSTSLLAIAKACQSLLLFESDMALAGGVSITLPQRRGYQHLEGGMVSADGSCRPFDAGATGTIFGSGAGVVLLKRVEEAMRDGDQIYAVIRGSGINNDGAAKVGFTAPTVDGQAAVIEMALANAGVDAREISYVECHGTATPLGDPIEIAGLTKAFAATTTDLQFCAIGSVKSNVGHLDAAAGVTGLIKTALALKYGKLPPTVHYQRPNPQIDFARTPFFVNDRLREWPDSAGRRRAGVSAFGVGGTNVHVVLEQPPEPPLRAPAGADRSQLLVVSARSAPALAAARRNLAAYLRQQSNLSMADVAFSLQAGRRTFAHRSWVVARDCTDAAAQLEVAAAGVAQHDEGQKADRVVFMFPGQGSQYPNMGKDLYETEPSFRRHLDECAELLLPNLGEDIRGLLYPTANAAEAGTRLMATVAAQPAIFSVEYALAKLWISWGIKPDAMIGHSVGEFVAAVLAGVFTLRDGLKVVAARGRLMQALPGGTMLAVRLGEVELKSLLPPRLELAAVNGPALCVVSGAVDATEAFEQTLTARSIVSRRLHTSHAFHSSMVEPVIAPLREELAAISLNAPAIPFVSCVTGDWINAAQATSVNYWASHAREPVRFADGIRALCTGTQPLLIEVGPGNALSTLARQNTQALQHIEGRSIRVVASMQDAGRAKDDRDCLLEAIGRCWVAGVSPDWRATHGERPSKISLPTYPFERARHWIDLPVRAPTISAAEDVPEMPETIAQDRVPEIRAMVAAIFEDLSGERPEVNDTETTFLEMGYDSLFLTQVAQRIQQQTAQRITFRQLLDDLSTIPALAAFLAERMPKTESPPSRPPPPVIAAGAGLDAARSLSAATPTASTAGAEIADIFREQLQAMSLLINRQFEMLQQGRNTPAAAAAPAIAPAAAPAPAPAAASAGLATPGTDDHPESATTPSPEAPRSALFQMYKPSKKVADAGLSTQHREHIDSLIARTVAKTPGSKRETSTYRAVSADPRVAAGFRAEWKEMVYPIVVKSAAGSKLIDVDGNEYIDLVNGYGQTALGHSPPFVVEAIREQLAKGFPIGPQAELTGKVAALFCELTGNERATFCNTGSEAVMAAMRVARTVTGRDKIVVFNGDYHGQFDEVLVKGVQKPGAAPRSMPVAPGIPVTTARNMVVLEYGTEQTLQWITENAHDIAAVVAEPVQSRHPNLRPFEFLRKVRAITEASGTAFVMDEVVTGFRVHPGGMQAVIGIRADLATYGKIVGGGLPVGVLAGKSKFMDALDGGNWNYGDDSIPETGVTFFAGTFVRHPLLLASAWAVLNHLKEQGPALQSTLTQKTGGLVERLNGLFSSRGLATRIETFASWFYFNFHNEHPLATLFYYHLRLRGIHIQDGFPCFLTTAHSAEDIERIYQAFADSIAEMQSVGILGLRETVEAPTVNTGVPLTESQLEIWLAAQLGDEASCAFNESVSLRMQGRLNVAALESAMTRVVARHDALRATFSPTGEEMRIGEPRDFVFTLADFSALPPAEAERAYAAIVDSDARRAFDLVAGPVLRAQLIKLSAETHVMILTAHHIVCDGWSLNVVVDELAKSYAALCRGEQADLPVPLAFSTYARTAARRNVAELEATEKFWLEQFASPTAPLELPTDRPRPAIKSFSGASLCRKIDAKLYQEIKKAGARQRSTLFVTLLAAFQALIGRLANQQEVVVGVPTAGQSLLEGRTLVGHCVNFLPLRAAWNRGTSVSAHLARTAKCVLDAYEHQEYTFGTLVRKLALPREPGRLPLAEIQFNLERLADRLELPDLAIEVTPNAKAHVNFDLFLNVIESPQGLRMDCDYNTDLFDAATVHHWLDCYQALLEAIVADAAQPLYLASCLPRDDVAMMARINDTAADFPQAACVHHLIEARVAATPHAIAAQFGDQTLTYEQLDRRAAQLGNVLQDRLTGAKTGRLVGVSVERSLEMLIALIAVHKAGCAYIPLDPHHPPARLRLILAEAEVGALISDGSESEPLADTGVAHIDVRLEAGEIDAAPTTAPIAASSGDDLAYVIYTSGSTGQPKGVEITHRSVVNLLTSMARKPGLAPRDVLYAVTTVSFDIAALELFLPLCVGARVVIANAESLADGYQALEQMDAAGATVMQATPAGWRLLLEAGFKPRAGFKMLCGGEALPRDLANRLLENSGELWNMYGPTETTIWSSCTLLSANADAITVGTPIANTQFYVLDESDALLPWGVPGQLHIGGTGVAKGYYKRHKLTEEKFIPNPFAAGRIYRTGDRARWLPNGDLQVLGRMDHQIKLRGFRIELGEIEWTLVNKAHVTAATVMLREDVPGVVRLVAYYVAAAGQPQSPEELKTIVGQDLPDYMVPSTWVRLDALPVSPNGKLDRAALPVPDAAESSLEEFVAPRSPTETTLTEIFAEVLRMERVGINADLLKMGADSIQLFQITARANRAGVKINARQLLQHRTAAAIAAAADAAAANAPPIAAEPSLPTLGQFQRSRRAGSQPRR